MAVTGDRSGVSGHVDASTVITLAELAAALRQLRRREARLRQGRELTYHQLAARTGWSATIIGAYLNGTAMPPTDRFDALVVLLGAGVDELGSLASARDRVADARRRSRQAETAGWTPPRELPAPPTHFVGRDVELTRLDTMAIGRVVTEGPAAVIHGMAGVGKTALTLYWAHRVSEWFPDGQLYIDLRGFSAGEPVDPADALARFLQSIGLDPANLPQDASERAVRYRSLLSGRRMLVVLDNAVSAEQIRPLMPGSPRCTVLVTSRDDLMGLVGDDAIDVRLDALSSGDATALLRRLIGDRVDANSDAAAAVAAICGGLPLAIRIAAEVAGRRTAMPLRDLVDDLSDVRTRLDILDTGEPRTAVRTVLSWSDRTLAPDAARLFRLLGLAPGPQLTSTAIASLGGLDSRETHELITLLERAHLLAEPRPGRYLLHDVLRAYATERAEHDIDQADRDAAFRRLLDHYLHTALLADRWLDPGRLRLDVAPPSEGVLVEPLESLEAGLHWFATERPTLLAAVRLAARLGHAEHAWQLTWAMGTYLDHAGYWQELSDVTAMALAGDSRDEAAGRIHSLSARAALRLGLVDVAFDQLRLALELFERVGDELNQASTLSALGKVYSESGAARDALHHHGRALALFRKLGRLSGEAASLNNLGYNQARLGEYPQALLACQAALALARRLGDRKGEAHCLDSLGYILRGLGEPDQAIECYHEAITLFEEGDARRAQADTWTNLGDAYAEISRPDDAADAWRFALQILENLDDRGATGVRARLATGGPPRPARA